MLWPSRETRRRKLSARLVSIAASAAVRTRTIRRSRVEAARGIGGGLLLRDRGAGKTRESEADQGSASEICHRILTAELGELARHRADALSLDGTRDLLQTIRGFAEQILLQRRAIHLFGGHLESPGSPGDFVCRLVFGLACLLGCRGLRVLQGGLRRIANPALTLLCDGARLTSSFEQIALCRFTLATGCGQRLVRRFDHVGLLRIGRGPLPAKATRQEDHDHHGMGGGIALT